MNYRGSTFGIAAFDAEHGEWGAAVQSKFLAVGALVPWVGERGGVILTMAKTNANIGRLGMKYIESHFGAEKTMSILEADDAALESRQFAIIDLTGKIRARTGEICLPYAGHLIGKDHVCLGNTLAGEGVLKYMSEAFSSAAGDLASRLMTALEAAQEAGGERRGMESAALLVNGRSNDTIGEINVLVNLRVDHAENPIEKLSELLDRHRIFYSSNHQNKYYPLTLKMQSILIDLLSQMHGRQFEIKDFKTLVERYNEGIHFQNPIFMSDNISGEFVHQIVEDYYRFEYMTLKSFHA